MNHKNISLRPASLLSASIRVVLSALMLAYPGLGLRADAPVGTVVNGNATFNYNGNNTTITAGDKTIIEYNRFNIDRDETVKFVQPTSTSRVLNRITGADPTSILGRLQANGIVYFVNPAGIYFGQNAIIDVGQLYAAAGSLSNGDFLARKDNFTRLSGQVFNEGTINAGAINLLGQNVRNTGALNSPAGLVMMAAGDDILIGERNGHIFVNATPATRQAAPAANPGVENSGQINAQGGRALLAAGDLYAIAVQNSGVIKARDAQLEGQGSGEVWNRGAIDATSANAAGGRVQVTGQYVGLDATSSIDASGKTGGGEVLIGGDFQGKNTAVRNATATYVAAGAQIRADATDTASNGKGGRVIVWADDTTNFLGKITATGVTGGGFAEVSGKNNLYFGGIVDLRSVNGKSGTLLLDPDDITISNGTHGSTYAGGTFTAIGGNPSVLNTGTLIAQLELSNVEVKTATGSITVADLLSYDSGNNLTLESGNCIYIDAPIINAGTGGLSLLTLWGAAQETAIRTGGYVEIGGSFYSKGNSFYSVATGSITAGRSIDISAYVSDVINGDLTAGENIGIDSGGHIIVSGNVIASTGGVSMSGDFGSITVGNVTSAMGQSYGVGSDTYFTGTGLLKTTGANADISIGGGGTNISLNGNGAIIEATGAVTLDAIGHGGAVDVKNITAGGAIKIDTMSAQVGRLISGGTITISADTINIGQLIQTTNPLAGDITLTAYRGDINLYSYGAIDAAGKLSVNASDSFLANATTSGSITAVSGISITSGSIRIYVPVTTTGAGDITLLANDTIQLVGASPVASGGKFTSTSAYFQFGVTSPDTSALTAVGDIAITATNSSIDLYRGIASTGGNITLNAKFDHFLFGTATVDAAGSFDATGRSFSTGSSANTITAGGPITITATGTDGYILLRGQITGASGNIILSATHATSSYGSITINAPITASNGGLTVLAHNDIVVGDATTTGAQTYAAGGNFSGTGVLRSTDATGDITLKILGRTDLLNGSGVVAGGAFSATARYFDLNTNASGIAADGDISITTNLSHLGLSSAVTSTNGSITLKSASELYLHAPITTLGSGDITLQSTDGAYMNVATGTISSGGALTYTGHSFRTNDAANTITALGNISITTTDLISGITLNSPLTSTSGDITLNSASILTANAPITATAGSLTATSGSNMTLGAVTTAGAQNYTYYSVFTATSGTLQTTAAGGNINLQHKVKQANDEYNGDIIIKDADAAGAFSATSGRFTLISGGLLRAAGDVTVSNPVPSGYTYSTAWVTAVNGAIQSTAGKVHLVTGRGHLQLTGTITSFGSQYYEAWQTQAPGTFITTDVATGDITFTYNGSWAGPTLDFASTTRVNAARDVSLNYPSASAASGTFTLPAGAVFSASNAIRINIPTVSTVALLADIHSGIGGIDILTGGKLILANATTDGTQKFTAGDITLTGSIGGAGNMALRSTTGSIALTGPNALIDMGGYVTATAATTFTTQGAANTIGAANSLHITAINDLTLNGDITATNGDIVLTSRDGNISAGAITATSYGDQTYTAGGDITLPSPVITGTGALMAGATGNLTIPTLSSNNSLSFTGSNIFLTGTLTTTNAANGDITLVATNTIGLLNDATHTGAIESAARFTATSAIFNSANAANTITAANDIRLDSDITLNGDVTSTAGSFISNGRNGVANFNANVTVSGSISATDGNFFVTALLKSGGDILLDCFLNGGFTTLDQNGAIQAGGSFTSLGGEFTTKTAANTVTAGREIVIDASYSNVIINSLLRSGTAGAGDTTIYANTAFMLNGAGAINSADDITIDAGRITGSTAANTLTAVKNITLISGNDIVLAGALASGSGNIALTANQGPVTLGAPVTSGTADAGTVTITAADGDITVGDVISGGTQSYTGYTFTGSGLLKTNDAATGNISISTPNAIVIDGAGARIESARDFVFDARSLITGAAANTITTGGNISGAANHGPVTFGGDIVAGASGAGGITLNVISGNVNFTGAVNSANDINVTVVNDGYVDFHSPVTVTAGGLTIDSSGYAKVNNITTRDAQTYKAGTFVEATGTLKNTTGDISMLTGSDIILSGNGAIDSTGKFSATSVTFSANTALNTITAGNAISITATADMADSTPGITLNGIISSATGGITLTAHTSSILVNAPVISNTGGADGFAAISTYRSVTVGDVLTGGTQTYIAMGVFTATGALKTLSATDGDIIIDNTHSLITGDGYVQSAKDIIAHGTDFTTASTANTLTADGKISIVMEHGDITLGGALASGSGGITLTSLSGDISVNAPVISGTANTSGVTMTATNGAITAGDVLSGGAQTYTSGNTFTGTGLLRSMDAPTGDIAITSASNAMLSGAGRIDSARTLTIDAASITTDGNANTIDTGNAISLIARNGFSGGIALNGAVTSLDGGITMQGGISISANAPITSNISGTHGLSIQVLGNISVADVLTGGAQNYVGYYGINLTGTAKSLNATAGNFTLISNSGNIRLTGDGLIDAAGTLNANSVGGNITTAAVANTITAANNVTMTVNTGDITLAGALKSTAGALTLTSTAGNITLNAPATAATTAALNAAAGNITVGAVTSGNSQTYTAINTTGTGLIKSTNAADGDITFANTGALTLTGAGVVESAASILANARTGITTTSTANTITAANNVTLAVNSGDITLAGALTSTAGALALTSTAGNIALNAPATAGTTAAFNATAGNITVGAVTSGNSQTYTAINTTGTGLIKSTNAANSDITFANTGALTLTGAGVVDSAASILANARMGITTTSTANTITAANNVTLAVNTGDITLAGALQSTAGALALTSTAGSIALNAPATAATTAAFNATAGNITVGAVTSGNSQTYTAINTTGTGLIKSTNAANSDITFANTGALTLTGAGVVDSAASILANARTGITTTSAANTITAANNVTLAVNTGDITLAGAIKSTAGALALTSTAGSIALNAPATAGTTAAFNASAGNITVGAVTSGNSQTYTAINTTGTGLIKSTSAANGDITFANTGTLTLSGAGAVDSAASIFANAISSITTTSAANTLTAAKNITLDSGGDTTLAGNLTASAGNITISTTNGGGITLPAHISTPAGNITLTSSGTGAINAVNATSSGSQTYTTTGGNITVTGTLTLAGNSPLHFSTTTTGTAGVTTIAANAALVAPGAPLTVAGGLYTATTSRISTPAGIDIDGAHAPVTLNSTLGGSANPLAYINIANAGPVAINAGIETSGAQNYATDGSDITINGLLKTTGAGININFNTHNATGTTGMTTVATGGLETNNATITSTGGLTLAANTTLRATGGGINIDGQGRAAAIYIDLGTNGNTLPQITIRNAGDIHLANVVTTGSQSYHFDDGAAMQLSGTLLATGNGSSITIDNTRATHASWATIFALGGNGIHIETLNGDITIGKYNTLYSLDDGAPSPTAGDILIRAWNGHATVSDLSGSHDANIIAGAITLNGTAYQAGTINILGMNGAPITTNVFTLLESSVNMVTTKNHLLVPPLPEIRARAYFAGVADEITGRISPTLFSTGPAPDGSIFTQLPSKSDLTSWMFLLTEAAQINLAADKFDKSLELVALEEAMRKATAGYLAGSDAANRITGATKEKLVSVGIFSRAITPDERNSQNYYRGLFQQIIGSEVPAPEQRLVADGRISEISARQAVELYQTTFMQPGPDGTPVSRASDIVGALVATYNAFRATSTDLTPAAFSRYIDTNAPTNDNAHASQQFINKIRELFAAIERTGLTRAEVSVAKAVLLRPLRTPQIPTATLRGIIEPATETASAQLPADTLKVSLNY